MRNVSVFLFIISILGCSTEQNNEDFHHDSPSYCYPLPTYQGVASTMDTLLTSNISTPKSLVIPTDSTYELAFDSLIASYFQCATSEEYQLIENAVLVELFYTNTIYDKLSMHIPSDIVVAKGLIQQDRKLENEEFVLNFSLHLHGRGERKAIENVQGLRSQVLLDLLDKDSQQFDSSELHFRPEYPDFFYDPIKIINKRVIHNYVECDGVAELAITIRNRFVNDGRPICLGYSNPFNVQIFEIGQLDE